MKINKWTLGLAALGLVSLTSATQAEEAKTVPLLTALSATTISGYVDTSMVWNPGTGNANPAPFAFNAGKQDGFNLDAVDIKLVKPLEEGQWSSGYTAEMMFGPDAGFVTGGGSGELGQAVREAHVDLRMPIGNGLDWQIGRFGNILGYESTTSYQNPNWTHSYAWTIEPTEHTGVLASYKVCESFSILAGVANTVTTGPINGRNFSRTDGSTIESEKSIVSLITLTAPESWGVLGGSALYAGLDNGFGNTGGEDRTHFYGGVTVKTPLKGLSVGGSYDYIRHTDVNNFDTGLARSVCGYVIYQATEKMSLNLRGEYANGAFLGAMADAANRDGGYIGGAPVSPLNKVLALTATLQYDLWANVISRLEVRWDHSANGHNPFGGTVKSTPENLDTDTADTGATGTKNNDIMVAANIIFKF